LQACFSVISHHLVVGVAAAGLQSSPDACHQIRHQIRPGIIEVVLANHLSHFPFPSSLSLMGRGKIIIRTMVVFYCSLAAELRFLVWGVVP
jgi:hypothetical protein